MSTRYYDVVVLGRSIGCLLGAALLCRRGFRVLVFGQGGRPARYGHERFTLQRRAFTLLTGNSPVWKKSLQELGQTTTFRRRARALDPMFSMLTPSRRFELPPDAKLFDAEVEREFPEVRQLVEGVYAGFADVNHATDLAFERDHVWPPGSFWERLETNRAAARLPFTQGESVGDLLAKFPAGHPYREVIHVPVTFATDLATPGDQLSPFALARLHGSWTRGPVALEEGECELERYLVARIQAHGGECQLDRRAVGIGVRRGSVVGVQENGEDEYVGTSHVLTDLSGELVADLSRGEGITARARKDWPRLSASAGRFVVSIVVRTAGLPRPLPRNSFLLPLGGARPNPRRPVVHLQRYSLPREDAAPLGAEHETLLVAETILPSRGPLTLTEARAAVMTTLRGHLPFIDEHIRVLDSPHDGLPLIETTSAGEREIDRIHLTESSSGPEPMQWQWAVDPPGYLGVGGEPIRGPIPGTYLVGKTVLPGLGQEGEVLAGWSAARIIARKYGRRQKMRSQLWSKIETN